ncbi:uncharacterized protein MAM_04433 [Metarhizium album ARSEF 1941]|uniref:Uncharacterized protein n=1 Tax=Metarhizium album (strain ARSEF 1941) TaxID=1081103 RepID=A0A0B2WTP1_METAS|nr:uncharacterized protein MAM_04433 [Metarhizium album ARSEF 1941]KHN97418.1 hypothetical protein MAM_04433 [Metarhizium album ARSEF 1941]
MFCSGRIFVVVPIIAREKVDEATVEIQGIHILDAELNSLFIQIYSTIKTDGQPFTTLQFPPTSANKFQVVNISQTVHVTNKDALERFSHAFLANQTLRIKIYGKTYVKPAGMTKKYPVHVNKVIEFNGLNLLNGVKLGNTSISFDKDVPNFNATAVVRNPSHSTLEIVNATFESLADNQLVGNVATANLLLRPGRNTFPIEARINQTRVAQIVAYCETGVIPFQLQGRKVQNHGQDILWLASASSNASMTVDISVAAVIESSQSANFCV